MIPAPDTADAATAPLGSLGPRTGVAPVLAAAMIELRAMLSARRLVVLALVTGIVAAIGVAYQVSGAAPLPGSGADVWPAQYLYWGFLRAVPPLVTLYIGTSLWSDEIESGTLVYVITRPASRPLVLLAKLIVAWAVVVTVVFAGMAGTGITLATLRGGNVSGLVAASVVLPVAAFAWLALFALCGTLLRRSLILGLIIGFAMEMVLANFQAVARTVALGHHVGSALRVLGPYPDVPIEAMVSGEPVAPWAAWLVLLGVAVGATAFACLRVRFQEYTPTRSD